MTKYTTPSFPFLWGAQYYRAPTPEAECWEQDFEKMKQLGFNQVKFWLQWRWSHITEHEYDYEDLDRLMNLAHDHGLGVTINIILDVAPNWLFEKYPDAKPVLADGTVVEPSSSSCRQIGGFPGPCYNHPGALWARQRFVEHAVGHFGQHPALEMWDVWNEPEQISEPYRTPQLEKLPCYCHHCKEKFSKWLNKKYPSLDELNQKWGRNYQNWEQVEIPRSPNTYLDFIDWRESCLDTMTEEAKWRLEWTRKFDGQHVNYLHVVANTFRIFNSVTGVDDMALAEDCDCFGSTIIKGPIWPTMLTSAANGKISFNAEAHIAYGDTSMYPRPVDLDALLEEFIPQLGMGVRGFLFWQYRPEVLGKESPAWGLVNLDGSDKELTRAARSFREKLGPHMDDLVVPAPKAQIAVLNSRKNELFHYAMNGKLDRYADSLEGYFDVLYRLNVVYKTISSEQLEQQQLDGVELLICPSYYYATQKEVDAIQSFVRQGGTVLCEASFAAYNADKGRHERQIPGFGLSESWGIEETNSTSSYHIEARQSSAFDKDAMHGDVVKAVESGGISGASHFDMEIEAVGRIRGAYRYAELGGDRLEGIGSFGDGKCLIGESAIGEGRVIYAGTHLGEGAQQSPQGLTKWLGNILEETDIQVNGIAEGCFGDDPTRIDVIKGKENEYLAISKKSDKPEKLLIHTWGKWRGVFSNSTLVNDSGEAVLLESRLFDLFVKVT